MERMQFVVNLLERAKIKRKYIDTLSTPASATYFDTAFTDPSYDESNNYLFLRSLGTLDLHRILVWHIFKKHPQVTQKTLTLVKINLLRDSKIGEFIATLGINAHILSDEKNVKSKKMSQNVFEAIVGAIAFIINHHKDYKFGIGNVVVSKLCTYVLEQLDQLDINVDKTSLDAKTTLKELYFDVNRMMRRLFRKDERKEDGTFHVELYDVGSGSEKLGEGDGATLIEAEQKASSDALLRLQKKGLIRNVVKSGSKKKYVGKVDVHYGKPVEHFHAFILNLLHQRVPLVSDLKLDKGDMAHFVTAFTSPDVNGVSNYELYETLGDNLLNNCVLWYISNRFSYLNIPEAVDLLTKIKIRIIQTKWIGELSNSLGFYDYIYCPRDLSGINKLKVLEDVFESFFAALNMVVDGKYKKGMGFIVCYRFLASLLDEKEIPISYEVLADPKTRLKELFDLHKTIKITYETIRFDADASDAGNVYVYVSHILESKFVRQTPTGEDVFSAPRQILSGKKGYTEQEAEQNVASDAIQYYKNMGITKPIPKEYLKFCM